MHILIVTDQHPDSLGGAQVAIRAQRCALEHAGHLVTIVAPAAPGALADEPEYPSDAELPASLPAQAAGVIGTLPQAGHP